MNVQNPPVQNSTLVGLLVLTNNLLKCNYIKIIQGGASHTTRRLQGERPVRIEMKFCEHM